MSHFMGVGIFRIGLSLTDLGCWKLVLTKQPIKFLINEYLILK